MFWIAGIRIKEVINCFRSLFEKEYIIPVYYTDIFRIHALSCNLKNKNKSVLQAAVLLLQLDGYDCLFYSVGQIYLTGSTGDGDK